MIFANRSRVWPSKKIGFSYRFRQPLSIDWCLKKSGCMIVGAELREGPPAWLRSQAERRKNSSRLDLADTSLATRTRLRRPPEMSLEHFRFLRDSFPSAAVYTRQTGALGMLRIRRIRAAGGLSFRRVMQGFRGPTELLQNTLNYATAAAKARWRHLIKPGDARSRWCRSVIECALGF